MVEGFEDDEQDVVECMHCGAEIYEDAERCPHCENYQTDFGQTATSQPRWVVLTAVLLLLGIAYMVLAPLFR